MKKIRLISAAAAAIMLAASVSVPAAATDYYYDGNGNIIYQNPEPNVYYDPYVQPGTVIYYNGNTTVYPSNGVPVIDFNGGNAKKTTTPKKTTKKKTPVKKTVVVRKAASGWRYSNGRTYYYKNGSPLKGLYKIDGNTYYFNPNNGGAMATGFTKIGKKKYYFGTDGVMRKGFLKINGNYYYFASNGVMKTGKIRINGTVYTFAPDGVLISPTVIVYYN